LGLCALLYFHHIASANARTGVLCTKFVAAIVSMLKLLFPSLVLQYFCAES
jgi:hypothetical protein